MGFSEYIYLEKPIFIKHFSEVDNGAQESERYKFFNLARKSGLQEKYEKEQLLLKEGLWTREKDDEIESLKKEVIRLEMLLKNLIVKKQIKEVKQKKTETELQLSQIQEEKDESVGFCVEDFVNRKMNELTIFNSFYKTSDFSQKLFTKEEFDNLEQREIHDLIKVLNDFYSDFAHAQIKRICACSFFINLFYLGSEKVSSFYGTHVTNLTILQVNMFSQGRYFESLINSRKENVSPPSDVTGDPDKMIEWYESLSSSSSSSPTSDNVGGMSHVGATEEELRKMAGGNTISLTEFAKKKGGTMTMKDFIEMHGA